MSTKRELEERVDELEQENQELQDQLDTIADIVAPDEALRLQPFIFRLVLDGLQVSAGERLFVALKTPPRRIGT